MSQQIFQVVPMGDGRWEVTGAELTATFDEKLDAVECARELASNHAGLVRIVDESGTIEAEHDYTTDRPG
jgi:hypothetical protein